MEPSELLYQAFIICIQGVVKDSRYKVLADKLETLEGSHHYKSNKYLSRSLKKCYQGIFYAPKDLLNKQGSPHHLHEIPEEPWEEDENTGIRDKLDTAEGHDYGW